MIGRTTRNADEGIAAVMGVILLLALAVTVYAHVLTTDVPQWGAEAERDWDKDVRGAFADVTRSLHPEGDADSVAVSIPPAPKPESYRFLFFAKAEPVAPSGAVAFEPACSAFTATHTPHGGAAITDLVNASRGCVQFSSDSAYSTPYGYHVELGGLVRSQGDRGDVAVGPALAVERLPDGDLRITLKVPSLRGAAASASTGTTGARIQVTPGLGAPDASAALNAGSTRWVFTTAYPAAWADWFDDALSAADLVDSRPAPGPGESSADYSIACDPVDCSRGPSGTGNVTVVIEGPRIDRNDLVLVVAHATYKVRIE